MKLKDACEIGIDCGLEMTGEALMNIEILKLDVVAISLFSYDKINEEITELRSEYNTVGNIPIQEYLQK
jgi:hypothetical protein